MKRILTFAVLSAAAHVGAGYLFRRRRRRHAGTRTHFLVTQGGVNVRPTGEEIADAVVSVLMDGAVLDLRDAELAERPARIDLLCVLGGVELVVPKEWRLRVDVEPVLGGVRDRRTREFDPERSVDLTISGRVLMGGLDISATPVRERSDSSTLTFRRQGVILR